MRNIDSYYEKCIFSGGVIEVYRYEKLNVNGGGARDGDGRDRDHNYRNTQRRRRNMIRQLITENFDSKSKFVTLTFDNDRGFDIKDVRLCNREFKRFIQRLKRRYPQLEYVAVIEFQDLNDRGAVHYHMICNLPYISKSDLQEIWGQGFVKINAIDKVDNVGAYVVKYMQKDIDDTRLQGLKAYNASQGLRKPLEMKSWDSRDEVLLKEIHSVIEGRTPSYEATYESDQAGQIEYLQFNLRR